MDIRQVLQGCCGTTMEQSDKQAVIDYVEGLQAQVKMLHNSLEWALKRGESGYKWDDQDIDCVKKELSASPEQCLADHDAEVAKAAYIDGASDYQDADSVHENFDFESRAEQYAANLRAKAGN